MERHSFAERLDHFEVAAGEQICQRLGVMLDRGSLAELRIFVLYGVVAVRVGGNDS